MPICYSATPVCRQTITAKVSQQNWCKVSQQKPWSCVVRQSPQTFHTRTGAKFHSKSHGRMWSDNHSKSFTPELVQSFTAKAMVVRLETIVVVVNLGRLSFRANACNKSLFRKKYVKGLSTEICFLSIFVCKLTSQLKTDCKENLYFAVGQNERSFSQPYSEKKKHSSVYNRLLTEKTLQ